MVGLACEGSDVCGQGARKAAADVGNWAVFDRVTFTVVLRTARGGSGLVPLGSASAAAVAHGSIGTAGGKTRLTGLRPSEAAQSGTIVINH